MNNFKKIVAIVLLPVFLMFTMPIHSFANPGVMVKSGTPVILRLTEEVSSKTKNLNDAVHLEVARDVVIDGKVVIKSGTPATGTITWVEKAGMVGRPGKIQFSVDSTRAVDGQNVMLKSTLTQMGKDETTSSVALSLICCGLFLLMKGKEGVFPVGTEVKAYTDGDIVIEVP